MSSSGVFENADGWFVFVEIKTVDWNYRLTHPIMWYKEIDGFLNRELEEIEAKLWTKLVRRLVAINQEEYKPKDK